MSLTAYALSLITKSERNSILSGLWRDRLTGDKGRVVEDDGNYIQFVWASGYRHTFKKKEFKERFMRIITS